MFYGGKEVNQYGLRRSRSNGQTVSMINGKIERTFLASNYCAQYLPCI